MKATWLASTLCVCVFATVSHGFAQDILSFRGPTVTCTESAKQAQWNEAMAAVCKSLGDNLKTGQGPWNLGTFSGVGCEIPGKGTQGADAAAASKANWRMTAKLVGGKSLHFQLAYLPREKVQREAGETLTPEASARMPYTARTMLLLARRSFARVVAAVLIDQLPYAAHVAAKDIAKAPPAVDPSLAPLDFPGRKDGWTSFPVSYNADTDAWIVDESPDKGTAAYQVVNSAGRSTQRQALSRLLQEKYRTLKVDERAAPGDTCGEWETVKPPPPPVPTPVPTAVPTAVPTIVQTPLPTPTPTPEPTPRPPSKSLFGWDAEPYVEAGAGAFGKGARETSSTVGGLFRFQPLRHALSGILVMAHYVRSKGSLDIRITTPPDAPANNEVRDDGGYVYTEGQVGLGYYTTFPIWGPVGFGVGPSVLYVSQGLRFKDVGSLAFSSSEAHDAALGVLQVRGGPIMEMGKFSLRAEALLSTNRFSPKEYEERGMHGQVSYALIGTSAAERQVRNEPLPLTSPLRAWAFFFGNHRDVLVAQDLARTSASIEQARLRLVTTQTLLGLGLGLGW